jgi:glycerol-3-phosphate dehydrogenase (NAD(P)+)
MMNELSDYAVGIVGAGSWGTALANMLSEKGYAVTQWVYEPELLEVLQRGRCNAWYLPGVELDERLRFTGEIAEAVREKQVVLWVAPVKTFRGLFVRGIEHANPDTLHVSAAKGIENETLKTVSQIAREQRQRFAVEKFCVLSGPSFAGEVSRKMPTAVVIASQDAAAAAVVQHVMAGPFFRTYTSSDVVGVELGGALKNVMAIASGIIEGLGLGANTRAALITRGLAEIIRLGTVRGADPLTFSGLSGIGDLVLTCTSTQSRNYSVGMQLARGRSLQEIMDDMKMVAEGVYTVRSARALSLQCGIDMPIVAAIHAVLFEHKAPLAALQDLMIRDLKQEKAGA